MDFKNIKITVIGAGFLMEYISPCFRAAFGEALGTNVIGSTVDAVGLKEKEMRLGFPVLLSDNDRALRELSPDLIFFAPPPSVVPQLVDECLLPYYQELREAGRPLPMLVAFPPSPAGQYYLERLGSDIRVVNIIPNMISSVGDEPVIAEACNLITYPEQDNWTKSDKALIDAFFTPMGHCLKVPPRLILQVLSAEMSAHQITELANVAAITFSERGLPCTYADTASVMRAYHQKAHDYTPKKKSRCSSGDIPDEGARRLLEQVFESWYSAVLNYLTEQGFPLESARRLLNPRYDLFCYEAQLESREMIVDKARKDATKGGMLELYMQTYFAVVEPRLHGIFSRWPLCDADRFEIDEIGRLMRDIVPAVIERARGLTKEKPIVFTPRQQSIMAGLLIKNSLLLFGEERGDRFLYQAIEEYGFERGRRMALRARQNGDPLDMIAYRVYNEWPRNTEGFRRQPLTDEPYLSYQVLSCPYCIGWEEAGLLDYAPFYCRNVDEALLKGFNPALRLEMPKRLSDADSDYCEFHWLDCVLNDENKARQSEMEARVGTSSIKDFCYHTAHIYNTLTRLALAEDRALGQALMLTTREEFARLTSWQELFLVLTAENQDFTVA